MSISGLERTQFVRLILAGIDRERLVDKKVPDFFATLPGIQRFVLRVTHPAKFLGRLGRFRAITAAHELDDSLAPGDLLPQNTAQIAFASFKNILPDWIVAQEYQSVGY